MCETILSVRDICVYYAVKGRRNGLFPEKRLLKAVDHVSFDVKAGEVLGIVGESGCGKSTTGRAIVQLEPLHSGSIFFQGKDISKLPREEAFLFKRKAQMIFQDNYSTLDPKFTIGRSIGEPLYIHGMKDKNARRERVLELLDSVGLSPDYYDRRPHEFSGGQRQRVGIARALALNPQLLVCDEPTSALDVSVQAQVLNLMEHIKRKFNLTFLFISHNLSVVKHICNRIAVMYLGHIVEMADCDELFRRPLHPYTQALIAAIPIPDPDCQQSGGELQGDVPSPLSPPKGCPFVTRCPRAMDVCRQHTPALETVEQGHTVACHLYAKS